jgi:hypothetical protein
MDGSSPSCPEFFIHENVSYDTHWISCDTFWIEWGDEIWVFIALPQRGFVGFVSSDDALCSFVKINPVGRPDYTRGTTIPEDVFLSNIDAFLEAKGNIE